MSESREARIKVIVVVTLLAAVGGVIAYNRWKVPSVAAPFADAGAAVLDAAPPDSGVKSTDAMLAETGGGDSDAGGGDAGVANAGGDAGCPVYSYDRGLKRGRELTASRQFDDAGRAFDEAVRARPYDARARAERAYAHLLSIDADGGAGAIDRARGVARELELARALTADKALGGQIAYNLALALERAGDAEAARFSLIRAAGLGSQEAAKRLGALSRCNVTAVGAGPDLEILDTWAEILGKLAANSTCSEPQYNGEAEARAYACGVCSGAGGTWSKGTCTGAGPWTVDAGYMHCSHFTGLIKDLGGRYYVEAGPGAQVQLEREGKLWLTRVPDRHFLWVAGHFDDADATYREGEGWTDVSGSSGTSCLVDQHADVPLELSTGCQASMGALYKDEETRTYYDDSGRWLAAIIVRDNGGAPPAIRVDASGLSIDGGGCKMSVPFARPDAGAPDAGGGGAAGDAGGAGSADAGARDAGNRDAAR